MLAAEVALGNLFAELLPAKLQKNLDIVPDLTTKDGISIAKKRIGQMGFFEETSRENLKRLQNIKKDKKVSLEIQKKEERALILHKVLEYLNHL